MSAMATHQVDNYLITTFSWFANDTFSNICGSIDNL